MEFITNILITSEFTIVFVHKQYLVRPESFFKEMYHLSLNTHSNALILVNRLEVFYSIYMYQLLVSK